MKILFLLANLCFVYTQNIPFNIGETLSYKAFISGIPAGNGELKVSGLDTVYNIPAYHVQFQAWTTGITKKLYPLNDKIDIWLDKDSLKTIKVIKKIQEGSYKKTSESYINSNEGWAIVDGDSISIPSRTQSPYSLFYSLRNENFSTIGKKVFPTIDGKIVTNLEFKVLENQKVKVPSGTFTSNNLKPRHSQNEKFKSKGEMSIWFSNDLKKLPVKILIKLTYGSLALELKNYIN